MSQSRPTLLDLNKKNKGMHYVLQQRNFVQSPQALVLRPFQTRKSAYEINTHTEIATQGLSNSLSSDMKEPNFDNAAFPENYVRKSDRRKQNLRAIARADNVIFEIIEMEYEPQEQSIKPKVCPLKFEDPYSEDNLPEIDEIFRRRNRSRVIKRKRKITKQPYKTTTVTERSNFLVKPMQAT